MVCDGTSFRNIINCKKKKAGHMILCVLYVIHPSLAEY